MSFEPGDRVHVTRYNWGIPLGEYLVVTKYPDWDGFSVLNLEDGYYYAAYTVSLSKLEVPVFKTPEEASEWFDE